MRPRALLGCHKRQWQVVVPLLSLNQGNRVTSLTGPWLLVSVLRAEAFKKSQQQDQYKIATLSLAIVIAGPLH